ncbi:MAG: GNAT family N-acetyltransferase [Ferruginibacter sp.]|nr:GNAT family N-acetyltransferase [Ferruginibacter sp.]NOU38876.1 GNAT family N-acetyltransferase [Ferruginibacter sp.]
MKQKKLNIEKLETKRLILIPFTKQVCQNILANDFSDLITQSIKKAIGWPDKDVIETIPKIITNLSKVKSPTGFESWMVIKKNTNEIIGDVGFKGFDFETECIDIGYGIIKKQRRQGYATEAISEIISWALTNKAVKEITASCLIQNTSSINILTKFNFVEIETKNTMKYWHLKNKAYKK